MVARKGKKRAIVAVARSILVIVYYVPKTKQPYREPGVDYFDRTRAARLKRYLVKRPETLGFQITVQSKEEIVARAT